MPLSPTLAQWLVGQGHDAVHAAAHGLGQAPDTEIVARARNEERIVVTADLDYPRILALSTADRPSVILFRGGNWSENETVERVRTVLAILPESELMSSLVVIERARIRKRTLPL
jgi:predicted nuclease of predicted toxin-antitoxin system